MFLIWSILTIPKHIIHLFPFFISLQRDDHSWWNFFFDLLRASDLVLSKLLSGLFGHLLFGFRFPGEISFSLILRENQFIINDLGSWSDLLDALVSWWIFSNNRRRPFRSKPFYHLNFFGSFDFFGRFCLLLCLCIILTWNPIDYLYWPLLLVVHQRFYCLGISSLWL